MSFAVKPLESRRQCRAGLARAAKRVLSGLIRRRNNMTHCDHWANGLIPRADRNFIIMSMKDAIVAEG